MSEAEQIWHTKPDDEVLEASNTLYDFTEAGEALIRDELKRRGLAVPPGPVGQCANCGRSIAWNHPGVRCSECDAPFPPAILKRLNPDPEVGKELDGQCVYVAHNEIDAQQVQGFLESCGIPNAVRGETLRLTYALTVDRWGTVEILVPDSDAERARELLASVEKGEYRLPAERDAES
jgi:hypothetical protein